MVFRRRLLTATVLYAIVLSGCSGVENTDQEPNSAESSSESAASPPAPPEPSFLPAGDLPPALTLKDVGARTVTALPFADFAVAAGDGVWVSGVDPGVVRYAAGGGVTARARITGEVTQALAAEGADVLVPSRYPNVLFRLDAATGAVRARVRLPASPVLEGAVGLARGKGYVLIDPPNVGDGPTIVVVDGTRIVDRVSAPDGALAVRAGYGALWVPTSEHTVERRPTGGGEWTSIKVGQSPRFLDVGFDAVWVMNQGDGSVTRIDAETNETEAIAVTGERIGGGDLTVGGGAVWLRTDSSVARIDPDTLSVTHLIELPFGSASAAATDDLLVISNHDHQVVHLVPLPLPR